MGSILCRCVGSVYLERKEGSFCVGWGGGGGGWGCVFVFLQHM